VALPTCPYQKFRRHCIIELAALVINLPDHELCSLLLTFMLRSSFGNDDLATRTIRCENTDSRETDIAWPTVGGTNYRGTNSITLTRLLSHPKPHANIMKGKSTPKTLKAQAMAALIAGECPTEVADRFGLPRESVRNWKLSLTPEKLAEVSRNSKRTIG